MQPLLLEDPLIRVHSQILKKTPLGGFFMFAAADSRHKLFEVPLRHKCWKLTLELRWRRKGDGSAGILAIFDSNSALRAEDLILA